MIHLNVTMIIFFCYGHEECIKKRVKLTRSVLAYKKKTVLARAIYVTRIVPKISMKYMQLRSAHSYLCGRINGPIKI